jgi:hypothetical protein
MSAIEYPMVTTDPVTDIPEVGPQTDDPDTDEGEEPEDGGTNGDDDDA